MAKPINNPSKANVLMESMRAMGYSFESAVADIVDNSIGVYARNVQIYFPCEPTNCFVAICDDGEGMDSECLFQAMRYGSSDPNKERTENDLGRFGLGLKTASLSQCRKLTVVSKSNANVSAYCWDLDYVKKTKDWDLLQLDLEEIQKLPCISYLDDKAAGTIVLWEKFDVIFKSTGDVFSSLDLHKSRCEDYLSLIFHRFINSKELSIRINNFELKGKDPFLENHRKTNRRKEIVLPVKDSQGIERKVTIIPYVIPFQKDLSAQDRKLLGGIENLRTKQGFYIYRNRRLIIHGTWFGIAKNELTKNARILVDIPNTLDDIWEIDIKKQNATIPKQISNQIRKAVEEAMGLAVKSQKHRGRIENIADEYSYIWDRVEDRGKYTYRINRSSAAFEFLQGEEISDSTLAKIEMMLHQIEEAIPYQQIYIDMSGNLINDDADTQRKAEILSDAEYLLSIKKSMEGTVTVEDIDKLFKSEPYCKYQELKSRIQEEFL